MLKKGSVYSISLFLFLLSFCLHVEGWCENGDLGAGPLLPKDERKTIVSTEYGEISAAKVNDGTKRGPYHLQFFTLDPNSLFLPVLLHTDMVFYVQTGSGKLTWVGEEEGKTKLTALRRGDVYRLKAGTVFYLQSNLQEEREKLRIYAIFVNLEEGDINDLSSMHAYSSISNLVLGFDKKLLQAAFNAPDELIEEITNATSPPAIVHDVPAGTKNPGGWNSRFLKAFFGSEDQSIYDLENKKKKPAATFNIQDADPDFENCNGRALTVTAKDLKVLKGSNVGIFMVNLTKGSMMGPHWNPLATEIAVVIEGRGMVRVVCSGNSTKMSSSNSTKFKCENRRFKVEEGDVFVVPRFHPMAQMSFNNGSFVFMGFSTASKQNHPQFLAGESSVLRTLDKNVLAAAFNVSNTTMDQFLSPQRESIILDCTSCAEEEERMMEEELQKKREEEAEKKRQEEEAERKKQEEEAERKRQQEEEAERKRQEEEAERKRQQEEEAEKKRQEEEAERKQQQEEEAERKRQQEEEAERKRQQEEEAEKRRQEEEAERKRQEEEAERKQQQEEEAERKRQEEAEARRREEEEAKEEERKREAAAEKEQEEAARGEEERQRREREEEKKGEGSETAPGKREQERREAAAEKEQEEAMKAEEERHKRERGEEVKYEIGGGGEGKRLEYSSSWSM